MNGKESFNNQYQDKIKILLSKSKYNDVLKSYYYSLYSGNIQSESSRYNYLRIISSFLNETNKNIDEINLDDYNYYKKNKNNCNSSYQIVIHTALKHFSNYLYESGRNEKDYMENSKRPKFKESQETREKREHNYLTKKEIEKLISSVNKGVGTKRAKSFQNNWKERDLAIITLFLTTGLRCSGIYKLDIDSIDFENKLLITTEKGDKIREITLSDDELKCLNDWIKIRKNIIKDENEQALFISNRKQRMKQETIASLVKKYASNIDGKNITPHKLRATYATQIYEKKKDAKLVQELMGHSNVNTTMLYIRNAENRTNIGSEIMSGLIF